MFKFLSYESISVINTYLQDVTLEKQNWQDLVIQRFGGAVKNALHFLQLLFVLVTKKTVVLLQF